MSLFPLEEGVAWDPMYITQVLFSKIFGAGWDAAWNDFLWFAIGSALLGYAIAALSTGYMLPLLSKRKFKRMQMPLLALILGMTFLIQAGQPDLLSSLVAKFGIDF